MLPEKLSNGLCSLNPNVERLAMVCEMAITSEGEVARYELYAGVIRSRARLTYTEVWERLSSGRAAENLRVLYELFHALFAGPAGAARSTSTRWRRVWCSTRAARSSASCRTAQRCAPHHRGVHARSKRMRHASSQATGSLRSTGCTTCRRRTRSPRCAISYFELGLSSPAATSP